jgi:hypothetical protein
VALASSTFASADSVWRYRPFRPGHRIALGREDHAAAEIGVVLHHGGRAGGRVGRGDGQAGDAEQGGDMVEVGLDGIGGHDRARGIVDALAQHLGVIGEDLKELGGRIAVAGLEGQAAFGHLVAHLRGGIGKDRLEIEILDDVRRGQAREIDSGEGSIGHARHLAATTGPRLWPALGWRAGHMPGWFWGRVTCIF